MIALFDIAEVNQSALVFNPEKLMWLNLQHNLAMPADEPGHGLLPFLEALGLDPATGMMSSEVAEAFRERAESSGQMAESARYLCADVIVCGSHSGRGEIYRGLN
jgi:glutamyl-tRNA synthetase